MITAIVLIDAEVDSIPEVAQQLVAIENVNSVYSVTGDVDLIAIVRVANHEDLARIIPGSIAKVAGIKSVRTYLGFQEFAQADLDAAYDLGLD